LETIVNTVEIMEVNGHIYLIIRIDPVVIVEGNPLED
jgi:hypothetical protein